MRTKCSVLRASESGFRKMDAFKTVDSVAVFIKKTDYFFGYVRFKVAVRIVHGKGGETEVYLFNPFFFEDIHGVNHDRVEDTLLERRIETRDIGDVAYNLTV